MARMFVGVKSGYGYLCAYKIGGEKLVKSEDLHCM